MAVTMPPTNDAQGDLDTLVSALAVPVLVADYSLIIDRFGDWSVDELEQKFRGEPDVVMECVPLARGLAASPEWIRLYGPSPITHNPPDLLTRHFTPERYPRLFETLIQQFTAPLKGISSLVREHTAPTMHGDVIVRSHWRALRVDDRPEYERVVVVDLDVTSLRQTQRHLEDTLESKDRLIATVGHELRNPMTSLMGFASILDSDWESLDEAGRREMASIIRDQSRDVAGLLDDLIAGAVGDSLRVSREELKLGLVLSSLNLTDVECLVDPTVSFFGDQLRVRQVLRNLIQNARRHGGAQRRMTSEVSGGDIRIHVADNGGGVPTELAPMLFEPYAHGGGEGSVGLGLSVSRMLAEAMGGSLEYHRHEGWTFFTLTLQARST